MLTSPAEHQAVQASTQTSTELEAAVASVEARLSALAAALRERDAVAIELQANELHQALAAAVERFMHATRHGGVPEAMRLRLSRASAQVARQRDTLARATWALDRAIDVLMPEAASTRGLYGMAGLQEMQPRGGSVLA